jgi:hypothetical protein
MKIRRLTNNEKEIVLGIKESTQIETINTRKNFINNIICDWVYENNQVKNAWFALYTQY